MANDPLTDGRYHARPLAVPGTVGVAQRERVAAFALVVVGHLAMGWLLATAMRPPVFPPPVGDEVVMYLEFLPPPAPVDEPETQPPPKTEAPAWREPPPPVRSLPRHDAPPMQAVFVPAPEPAPDQPRELVAPERDPFHRPPAPADQRFGRQVPEPHRNPGLPRIAGERPVDAPLQELRAQPRIGAKEIVGLAAIFGGGPDAPVEAPCGGRVNSDVVGNGAFSPNWRRDYGCGDNKDSAGFTGKVELPPGTAR